MATNEVPKNEKIRKPTPKKEFSLNDFKKKIGGEDIPFKPFEWIKLSKAYKEVSGYDGIAKGYINLASGWSNSGKSTVLCESIVSAQKSGILPIIIDTENNLGEKRLKLMGFDFDNDFYIKIDNEFMLENFGKKHNKNRKQAAIEDMAECIHYFLDLQENGDLPFELLFAIDSIGVLDCIKSIDAAEKDGSNNNMWNAGAYASAFKGLINFRIPNSKKINKQYTNTLVAAQKVWFDSMVGGQGTLRHSGGESFYSAARLICRFGGQKTHGTSKISCVARGIEVSFGVKSELNIVKSHIDSELGGISFKGNDIISTPHGFIGATKEDIDNYKKEHIQFFRSLLGGDINLNEIDIKESKIKDDEKASFDFNSFDNENSDFK